MTVLWDLFIPSFIGGPHWPIRFLLPPSPFKTSSSPLHPLVSPIIHLHHFLQFPIRFKHCFGSTLYFIYLHLYDPRASVAYFIWHDLVICAFLQTKFLIDPFTRRKASYNFKTVEHCVRHPNAPNLDKSTSNRRPDKSTSDSTGREPLIYQWPPYVSYLYYPGQAKHW